MLSHPLHPPGYGPDDRLAFVFAQFDCNVIGLNWSKGAKFWTYYPAAANTESVGALIGAMVNKLRIRPGSNKHFWCIGHSLGAHACGYSSATARPKLNRITGKLHCPQNVIGYS